MSVSKELYRDTLNVAGEEAEQRLKRKRALQRAYQQRSFEIEHYWKRAGYFWGFQLVIFAAFGLIWKEVGGPQQWGPLALAFSSLGVLTALANRLSAGGSKFWQENWEKHIDMLEDEFEGRLYKTIWLPDAGWQYSVSKVNLALSSYFVVFWTIVLIYVACRFLDLHLSTFLRGLITPQTLYVAISIGLCCLGAIWLCGQITTLNGTIQTADGSTPVEFRCPRLFEKWCRRVDTGGEGTQKAVLFRRHAPNEPVESKKGAVA